MTKQQRHEIAEQMIMIPFLSIVVCFFLFLIFGPLFLAWHIKHSFFWILLPFYLWFGIGFYLARD